MAVPAGMMERAPQVSVILVLRHGNPFPRETAESVLSQTRHDFELLIVAESGAFVPIQDGRIRLLAATESGNTAECLNFAIGESRAPWILWLEAGDRLLPGMLEQCLAVAAGEPSLSIIYTDHGHSDGGRNAIPTGEYDFESLKRREDIPRCALFSRRAWVDVGGFRTNVEGIEAWDFWIACGSRGFRGRRIPAILVTLGGPGSGNGPTPSNDLRIAQMRINNRECFSHDEIQEAEGLLGRTAGSGARPSFHPARSPMVSVVIPTYNRADTLRTAVESVQAQTFRDFEIVVVSDCGSNDLEHEIRAMNLRQNITYVRHGMNRGLGASRNTGVGATRGKYIAYLDDDDFFYPDHLQTLVAYLENTGEKVAYTDAHRIWQRKVDGVYSEFKRDAPYAHDFDYDLIQIHNFVPVLCFLHARECLRETGGFDESLSTHEDWDLWIRMSRKYRMNHIRAFTSAFTQREDGTNMSDRRKSNFLDTTLAIYSKNRESLLDRPDLLAKQKVRIAELRLAYGIPPPPPERAPGHRMALQRLESGDVEGALSAMAALAARGEGNSCLYEDLAGLLLRAGRTVEAEVHFRKSLESDPGSVSALRGLGEVCLRQKRLPEAMEFLRKAFAINPDDPETSMSFAMLSESVGQIEVARQFYCRVLDTRPDHAGALDRLNSLEKGNPYPNPNSTR